MGPLVGATCAAKQTEWRWSKWSVGAAGGSKDKHTGTRKEPAQERSPSHAVGGRASPKASQDYAGQSHPHTLKLSVWMGTRVIRLSKACEYWLHFRLCTKPLAVSRATVATVADLQGRYKRLEDEWVHSTETDPPPGRMEGIWTWGFRQAASRLLPIKCTVHFNINIFYYFSVLHKYLFCQMA